MSVPVKWVGLLWLASVGVLLCLLWQALAGWPLHRTAAVGVGAPGALQTYRFPESYAATPWQNALAEIRQDGRSLTLYADRDSLAERTTEGYAIKGKSVFFRARPGAGEGPVMVVMPWAPRWEWLAAGLAVAALTGGWLHHRGSPIVRRWTAAATRCSRWAAQPRVCGVLAGAVLLLAIALRCAAFSFPVWANDTPTYMPAVVAVMEGHPPDVTPDRPFGYAVVMGHLLRWWPDFRTVVTAQMASTLAAAVLLAGVVWLAAECLFAQPLARQAGRLAAVALLAILGLNESILEREWALLGEGWVPIYLGLQAALAWWLVARPHRFGAALGWYALFSAAGVLTFFTRSNWGFALAALPLPWVVVCWRQPRGWLSFFGWGAAGATILLGLFAAAFSYQQRCTTTPPLVNLSYRALALVCWHVPLVRPEIERRLQHEPEGPGREVLQDLAVALDAQVAATAIDGAGSYPSLGYDADYLFFRRLPESPHFGRLPTRQRTLLCTEIFRDALRRHPEVYARKVLGQMRLLFQNPYRNAKLKRQHVAESLATSEAAPGMYKYLPPKLVQRYVATLAAARAEFEKPWPSRARMALCLRAGEIDEWLEASFVWAWALPMAAVLLAWGVPAWRRRVPWGRWSPVLTVACWASLSVVLSALSSAATQGLDVQRYLQLSVPLTLLSQVLWPMLGVAVGGGAIQLLRENTLSAEAR